MIEQWARAVGCWTDNVDTEFENIFGIQLAEGGEAHVYDNGASIVKRIGLDYFVLPMLAFDRITLHNTLFPSTKMTVIGYGATTEGEFQILVQQQFIHGSLVSEIIDCDIRINTPELRCGGIRSLTNDVRLKLAGNLHL